MKKHTKYFSIVLITCTLTLGLFYSCSDDDDGGSSSKKYLITKIESIDYTQNDFNNVENIWEYKYDENQKLILVIQYNPRNISHKIENKLTYNSNDELVLIEVYQEGQLTQHPVTHVSGIVSLEGMGASFYNYYYKSNRIITKKEAVFTGMNTNFQDYNHNGKDQIVSIDSGTDGIINNVTNFSDYDSSDAFQFFNVRLHPTTEFIIMYAFDLKYNGLGKPSKWEYGNYEYIYDENNNVIEINAIVDFDGIYEKEGLYRFSYEEIN